MLTAREVLDRMSSGYYGENERSGVRNSIKAPSGFIRRCIQKLKCCVTTSIFGLKESALGQTYTSSPHEKRRKKRYATENYSTLHCNATSGMWDQLSECFSSSSYSNQSSIEAFSEMPYINQSQSVINSEELISTGLTEYEKHKQELIHKAEERRYLIIQGFVTAGHALSLLSLVISLTLLFMLKRLHCTRIYIHMNLMIAFILRGLVWLLHATAFQDSSSSEDKVMLVNIHLGKRIFGQYSFSDLSTLSMWKETLCDPFAQTSFYVRCRFYFVMVSYSVTANYYWLLVEGLYLGLVLRAMNPNKNHKLVMRAFLVLGWVLPWVSVIGGVVAKIIESGNSCWFQHKGTDWWIINIPIIVALLINFVIFILVVRVVGSKLKKNQHHRAEETNEDYKWRLTKSTLALIPLLGIQYIITVFFDFLKIDNATFIFVERAFEIIFVSLQGFMVALIYCFLNGEIQDELKRYWQSWKTEWELSVNNNKRRQGVSQTSLTNLYLLSSRKTSGVSTASTRRSDSIHTFNNGRSNIDGSPKHWRRGSVLTEIAEQSPVTEAKGLSSYNSSNGSCPCKGSASKSRNLLQNNYKLSVPGWDNLTRSSSLGETNCNQNVFTDEVFNLESESLLSDSKNHSPLHDYNLKTTVL